jgi:hypothetical protein
MTRTATGWVPCAECPSIETEQIGEPNSCPKIGGSKAIDITCCINRVERLITVTHRRSKTRVPEDGMDSPVPGPSSVRARTSQPPQTTMDRGDQPDQTTPRAYPTPQAHGDIPPALIHTPSVIMLSATQSLRGAAILNGGGGFLSGSSGLIYIMMQAYSASQLGQLGQIFCPSQFGQILATPDIELFRVLSRGPAVRYLRWTFGRT